MLLLLLLLNPVSIGCQMGPSEWILQMQHAAESGSDGPPKSHTQNTQQQAASGEQRATRDFWLAVAVAVAATAYVRLSSC